MPFDVGMGSGKRATLYREVIGPRMCPLGLKAKALLERHGFAVDDHWLRTHHQADAFKRRHHVKKTPQVFIDGQRVGDYAALMAHFGEAPEPLRETRHQQAFAVYAVAALMAMAISYWAFGAFFTVRAMEWFAAVSICMLGVQKLVDIEAFRERFAACDLAAKRFPGYAALYPWAQTLAGLLIIAGASIWLAAPIAIVLGAIGTVSVFRAALMEKPARASASPAASLTESTMTLAIGIWMAVSRLG